MADKKLLKCRYNPVADCRLAAQAVEHKTKYDRILEYSMDEIYVFNADTLLFDEVSSSGLENLGYTSEEMKQMTPADIKPALSMAVFKSILAPLRAGTEDIAKFKTIHKRKNGTTYEVLNTIQYIDHPEPAFIAIITDITDQNRHEAELKALAFRDPGTDLYNRRYFCEALEGAINQVVRTNSSIALILIDMDDFGAVNNEYGHLIGDKIITNFCDKIKHVFHRKSDVVARYGGDEFVVMCIGNSEEDLLTKCNELIKLFNEPYHYEGANITQTASIGICIRPTDVSSRVTSEDLIKGADQAMYKVKDQGKNSVLVCNNEVK